MENPESPVFDLVLNPGRAKKRKPLPSAEVDVQRAFDPEAFNFWKVSPNDFLFSYKAIFNKDEGSGFGSKRKQRRERRRRAAGAGVHCTAEKPGPHAVFINPFPIGVFSIILAPFYWEGKPQVLDQQSLEVGMHFMQELGTDPEGAGYMRVGYNSLAACASINHLHFQAWLYERSLPLEVATQRPVSLKGNDNTKTAADQTGVQVFEVENYPIKSLVFKVEGVEVKKAASVVWRCVGALVEHNVPHSLVMNESHVFVLPRQPQQAMSFSSPCPGFPEAAGEIILLDKDDFLELRNDPQRIYNEWQARLSLSEIEFEDIRQWCAAVN